MESDRKRFVKEYISKIDHQNLYLAYKSKCGEVQKLQVELTTLQDENADLKEQIHNQKGDSSIVKENKSLLAQLKQIKRISMSQIEPEDFFEVEKLMKHRG